ncbi:ATP-binding protein [Chloroflexus sp.]|uniref:ATP-binding protein n=1 Tax=Chloroflexus sp. TaxID=1904827 RepID=UPI003C71CFC4
MAEFIVRHVIHILRSRIQYTIILPYLALIVLVLLVGSGIAITLVAGSWQERFNNQLGQIARRLAEELALREISSIAYLGQIVYTAANADTGTPSVIEAMTLRDTDGLAVAVGGLWTLGQINEKVSPDRLIIFDETGATLLDWESSPTSGEPVQYASTNVAGLLPIEEVLRAEQTPSGTNDVLGTPYSGLIAFRRPDGSDVVHFFTVAPVYTRAGEGEIARLLGGVFIAQRLDHILMTLQARSQADVIAILANDGAVLVTTTPTNTQPALRLKPAQIETLVAMNEQGNCLDIGLLSGETATAVQSMTLLSCSLLTTVRLDEQEYQLVYAPFLIRGLQYGYFAVGLSRDVLLSVWAGSRNVVIGITVVLVVMSVLVGYGVARRITHPIDELVAVADAVSAGDFAQRSNVRDENELGRLALAVNQMTSILLHLYETSRQLNQERRVEVVLQIAITSAVDLVPGIEAIALLPGPAGWNFRLRPAAPLPYATLTRYRWTALPPQEDRLTATIETVCAEHGIVGLLTVPLRRDRQMVGMLIFAHTEQGLSAAVLPHIQAIADMTAVTLVNAIEYELAQHESERQRAILAAIDDGVIVTDADGRIILLNTAAERLLQPIVPVHGELLLRDLPPEIRVSHSELFGRADRVIAVGKRFLTVRKTPMRQSNGDVVGEVMVLHDNTNAVRLDRAKTDVIATIAQELRFSLTDVRDYFNLLQRTSHQFDAEQLRALGNVQQRLFDIINLVNNMALLAQLEADQIKVHLQATELAQLVETTISPLRTVFTERGVQITLALPLDLPMVMADRELLQHALYQVLDNARRYVTQGRVLISAGVEGNDIWLSMSDTGPAIPTDVAGLLFTQFQRHDNSSQRSGELGLPIARHLLELQGGSINVRSTPGQGCTFTIRLRRVEE